MKILKILNMTVLSVSLILAQGGLADNKPPTVVPGYSSQIPKAISLNPESLRKQLLETNLSVTQNLNYVKDAKDNVSKARAQLFPSLNLGAMTSGGGAGFMISSISFLLPFLAPSNWFNYKAQKKSYEAEKISFRIMELNLYSTALSLYLTAYTDLQTEKVVEQEAKDLLDYTALYRNTVPIGGASAADILVRDQLANSTVNAASQLAQRVAGDLATITQTLGLPESTQITLEAAQIPPSPWEDKNINDVINESYNIAPERLQINALVGQANNNKWSTAFGFINTSTLGSTSTGSTSASLSSLSLGPSISVGFGYFPSLRLAKRQIVETQLLFTQLAQSNQNLIDTAMKSLVEAKKQLDSSAKAEADAQKAYDYAVAEYQIGITTIDQVIYARTQIASLTVARLGADLNLNLQRVVLHRALLTDQFSQIKGCNVNPIKKGKISIDQLCHSGS